LVPDGYNMSTYKTLLNHTTGQYNIKGSSFLSFAFPVSSETEFKSLLQQTKLSHPQAVHHCYAFRIGIKGEYFRFSDDGEPSNSAGKPIYGQLLSFEVTNCAIIVVRYYGGIKLGVGGLISAYKEAAKSALECATIQLQETQFMINLTFNYDQTTAVNNFIHKWQPTVLTQVFVEKCQCQLSFPTSQFESIINYLNDQIDFDWSIVER
jgi:uncharacterized YigZ family protein